MKKLLFFMALLSIMISCKKTSYVAKFDKTPQERVADKISLVSTTLTEATNGWVATLPTQTGGGFGFYLNFDKEQHVTMYADLTETSSSVGETSYYRVKQDNGIGLVFDSYNYISMLNDPNSGVYGGTSKVGYGSDIEFTFDRINGDSIVFVGKKYRQPFILIKATAAQKASYENGGLKTAIKKFKDFFAANKNPYVDITSGSATLKIGVTPNLTSTMNVAKRVDYTGVLGDGKTVGSTNAKFAYNLSGVEFLEEGLVFEGVTFVRFAWKDATTLAAYDKAGTEYIIKNSTTPIVPLHYLWGTKYSGMFSDYKTIYPGTSASGAVILNYFHNNLKPPVLGYTFNYGDITLNWNVVNKRLIVDGFSSQNGGSSGWVTTSSFNYTVDDNGIYTFTLLSAPSGGYVEKALVPLYDFLKTNRVKFDYYADGATVYGKMTSVNDPSIEMTFALQ